MSTASKGRTVGLGVLAMTLLACAPARQDTTPQSDQVTAIVLPYLTMMPFYIADEEGYFAEQDLDVRFQRLGRNQDIMTALAHGDADVAMGMVTLNELGLIAAGARLRVVAALGEAQPDACTFHAVLVRRDHVESGAVADPDRIRRFRFDVSPSLPVAYFVDELLKSYGLTMADVDAVDLTPPVALEMLRRGDIDATVDGEPYVTMHLENGAAVWRAVKDLLPGYVTAVAMFGPTLLDERPEVGERLAVALLRAIRQYRMGKTQRNLAIVARAMGLPPADVAEVCWPTIPEDARVRVSTLRGYEEWSVAHGLLDRVLDDDELVDQRFMDFANAALAN